MHTNIYKRQEKTPVTISHFSTFKKKTNLNRIQTHKLLHIHTHAHINT